MRPWILDADGRNNLLTICNEVIYIERTAAGAGAAVDSCSWMPRFLEVINRVKYRVRIGEVPFSLSVAVLTRKSKK